MSCSEEVSSDDLRNLLELACKTMYRARESDTKGEKVMNNCMRLFSKDYKFSVISNNNGELSNNYPSKVVILEYTIMDNQRTNERVESIYDLSRLRELFNKARFARCRARFIIPTILYEGRHICRASTISSGAEIYGRSGIDLFFTGGESIPEGGEKAETSSASASEWQLFNRFRGQDIKLLKTLSVGVIIDLMVEKKKVKFGMNVTSSEKVDKENRYSDFSILSLPYPGCEFFKDWRDNSYLSEGLFYDWNQGFVDAHLDIPPSQVLKNLHVDWLKYKSWDLVELTQNYLKLLLQFLKETDSGILVHCISGWDRTPLFISLLRLSLWADGAVHTSLSPVEILYLTLAYDWFLFGHNLPDRLTKGEEILFFCFNFLKHITSDDFSVRKRSQSRTVSRTDSECNIDGVLLEPDLRLSAYLGSNTSISSSGSGRSGSDNAPLDFTTANQEDDAFMANGNSHSVSSHHRVSPASRLSVDHTSKCGAGTYATTSPVTVPSISRLTEQQARYASPSYGSWQMISGTGSLRGSASSHESPKSSSAASSVDHTQPSNSSTESADPYEETPRKQRLDAVRRTFLSIYLNTALNGFKPPTDAGAGGLAGLLDQFAEKVGIRNGRSSIV